MIALYVNIIGQ